MYAAGFSLLTGNWCAAEDQVEKTHPVSDCWCFFRKRDGIAAVQTIQSFFLLFLTDHLVHSLVRDHRGNSKMLSEDYRQIVRRHEAVGDMACRTVVVGVDLLAAHTVGHRQSAAGLEQAGERCDQTLGIGEMRKRIVDHNAVKQPVKCRRLHIAAQDRDALLLSVRE